MKNETITSPYQRALKTSRWLLGRVQSTLLVTLLLYKLLTIWFFIPLMQQIWALALHFSPTKYITTDNLSSLFASPFILLALPVIGVLTAWWALYEFSLILCGLDYARCNERCRFFPLLSRAAVSIRHALHPKNWGILLYAAVLIPFTNVFLSSTYISQLAVPEYISETIHDSTAGSVLYFLAVVLLSLLALCWVMTFHFFILEGNSFQESHQKSFAWIRSSFFQNLRMLICYNILLIFKILVRLIVPALLFLAVLTFAGLKSTRLMLALWRSFSLLVLPFAAYLINGLMTLMSQSFLSACYYEQKNAAPLELQKRLPDGTKYRKGGRLMLGTASFMILSVWLLLALLIAVLPDGDNHFLASYFMPDTTVTSHRGYSAVAPENTIPAFEAAIEAGADCAELDVQMTKDGVVMVMHDTNLSRTTGKNANIYDLTYAEARALDAGSFFSAEFAGTRLPTLEEVLQTCKGKIRLNIEIKSSAQTPDLEKETARLILDNGWADDCVVTSLSYDSLVKVKAVAPQIKCGYIMAIGVGNYYDLEAADFFSVESTFITSGMIQQLHLRGKTVSAWTIDREEDARRMVSLGVDDIITGNPVMVQQVLKRRADEEQLLIDWRNLFQPDSPEKEDPFETISQLLNEA